MDINVINKNIIIWGTDLDAVKCMYTLENKGNTIDYFLNTACKIDTFKGYKVYEPSLEMVSGKFIIVATTVGAYLSISKSLNNYGLKEFDDYIYYDWIDKKLALLHGNCYMEYYNAALMSSKEFTDKYSIYPNLLVFNNKGGEVDKAALERIELWIHQNISDNNVFSHKLSDSYIKRYISDSCEEIVVPNFVGLQAGMFPQCGQRKEEDINHFIRNGEDKNGMFPYVDTVIEKAIDMFDTVDDIYDYCSSDVLFKKEEILQGFDEWITKIEEREKRWDVKILDYILNNYKDKQLFYDIIHPTEILMNEMVVRLMKILGIKECVKLQESIFLHSHEMPVYSYVSKILDLKWSKKTIRDGKFGKRVTASMDLREYIKEYAWWCYDKML